MAQENSALIRRWFEEVWNKGRMEAIDEMASPDVIGHGQAQHDTDIGLHEFRIFAVALRARISRYEVVIDQTLEQGDSVVARWTATMTHRASFWDSQQRGRKPRLPALRFSGSSDGKIVEGWDNWDQLGLLVQIGAVPAAHFVARRTALCLDVVRFLSASHDAP